MNFLLLFLLMGKGIPSNNLPDTKLMTELSPFLPMQARRGIRALCEYETCVSKPDFYKGEVSKNPEQLFSVIEHISRNKTPIMLFRLMSSMGKMQNLNPNSPEGLSAMLSAILPEDMRKNLPDIPTLINMINLMQSISEDEDEDADSGADCQEKHLSPPHNGYVNCSDKAKNENFCPREIRKSMNMRQRRMFGQLLHNRHR